MCNLIPSTGEERGVHSLPPLQYDYAALEPHICSTIMQIHHTKHHQGYINNLKAASEKVNKPLIKYKGRKDEAVWKRWL